MKYIFNLLMLLILSFSTWVSAADIKVNFTGSIRGTTCSIETNNLNVDLGLWLLKGGGSNFPVGDTTDWVEFELQFVCNSVNNQVSGSLRGVPASDNKSFALDNVEGKATGMGIQIEAYSTERKQWEAKNVNEVSTLLGSRATVVGSNSIKLRAHYKSLADNATAGKANASITFLVQNN